MVNLDDVTVFNDLRERLAAITPAQIDKAARKLRAAKANPAAKIIGTIESETTRAIYTLFTSLSAESSLERALADAAIDDEIERDHKEKASVLDMISEVAKELFWAQAKLDLGFHEHASVGLRAEWQLISEPCNHSNPLASLLGSIGK